MKALHGISIAYLIPGAIHLIRVVVLAAAWTAALTVSAQTSPIPTYYFTTLAGSASMGIDDGVRTAARFSSPYGIAMDGHGLTYVADSASHTIRKVTMGGIVTTVAGRAGEAGFADSKGASAQFNYPVAVAADGAGNLYVADTGNRVIRKIAPDGTVSTLAGAVGLRGNDDGTGSAARFDDPRSIAVDGAGNVYVGEFTRSTIRKITPAGVVTTLAGTSGEHGLRDGTDPAALFFEPTGLAAMVDGTLFIGDRQVIRKITPAAEVSTLAGRYGTSGTADGVGADARFTWVWGVAVDPAGNVYVADMGANTLRRITPAGTVTTLAGAANALGDEDGTGAAARFAYPTGVAVDLTRGIMVADRGNNTIRTITATGEVNTLAGLSPFDSAGSADGTGAAARFYEPDGVAVGPSGDLFIADRGNHIIRKVTPAGVVTTLAGLAGAAGHADGTGAAARFNKPLAVAVDAGGMVYVADAGNCVIRRITPAGAVTTIAGSPGVSGLTDGAWADARFTYPQGIVYHVSGRLFVLDTNRVRVLGTDGQVNSTNLYSIQRPHTFFQDLAVDAPGNVYISDPVYEDILKLTPQGNQSWLVSVSVHNFEPHRLALDRNGNLFMTDHLGYALGQLQADGTIKVIAGQAYSPGHIDGIASSARFHGAAGIAVDAAGNLYVTSEAVGENTVRKGQLGSAPVITTQPQSQNVTAGGNVQMAVVAAGDPAPTYQWYFNGSALAGATAASFTITPAFAANTGDYTVVATNQFGSVTSNKATLTVTAAPITPSAGGGGGGGGGAPSGWFLFALAATAAVRRLKRFDSLT